MVILKFQFQSKKQFLQNSELEVQKPVKRIISIIMALLTSAMLFGCDNANVNNTNVENDSIVTDAETTKLGEEYDSFGERLEELNLYEGYFEEDAADITVECVSGTNSCYKLDGNTLTFTSINEDSVYSITGKLKGNIVIDVGDNYRFDLELTGVSLVSDSINPITVLSGDEVSITAKNETSNYIYDNREAVGEADESLYSGAIYSVVDLEICGKGKLTVVSENNNGIHTKDDLQVKNLDLTVSCVDNALKGNDSIELENANATLISTSGDGIKTSNSNISEKGNQRGTVTVSGGNYSIYAACDGIDAAYNVVVEGEETDLNIFTDKYSNYSTEVTVADDEFNYIRFTTDVYKYSVKYYNSEDDYCFVNAEYHSTVSGGRNSYYYYQFPKMNEYSKMQFFIYYEEMTLSQEEEYLAASDYLSTNEEYDTLALESYGNRLVYNWTSYTTNIQDNAMGDFGGPGGMGGRPGGMGGPGGIGGPGGMNDGNADKGEYSTKGIKAANEIYIYSGKIYIKSYDDAIHANGDTDLENGESPMGNISIDGGAITVFSNDDGVHADGLLNISDGVVNAINSYEGLEGSTVKISGGRVAVISSDDGVNATTTVGEAVEISGGSVYINCNGDGIDSNSRTSYSGIVFSGGNTVVISSSGGNSAIDTEQGYQYEGGSVIAIMPSNAMINEATHCLDFSECSTSGTVNFSEGEYLTVNIGGKNVATIKSPSLFAAAVIYLGSDSASFKMVNTVSVDLDDNGVWFN